MNVGLPGTGIGGLFYFFSILFMLFVELVNLFKKNRSRHHWSIAKRLIPMVAGIVFSMLLIDWLISRILVNLSVSFANPSSNHVLTIKPIFYSTLTLVVVLFLVNIIKFFIKPLQPKITQNLILIQK